MNFTIACRYSHEEFSGIVSIGLGLGISMAVSNMALASLLDCITEQKT